ncbi:ribosome small subunit-dependent GTPase A [Clostridium cellulovorans]|uniref:Small ribosomal subunit biogenesis GTPase RsgA n=1 Tax=Clostridium cellulovorans (strain ATCC 35296 / DSM 3052 / OCM 3 / 743B) TaxID=573061 RepID=D9SLA7_CLOC7|nr:ribosome small subunit-dependent GTPase A [Clostridium cellulovorans]ADL51623.1 ribosome small subunit-dependent GTPase A [Clostridium cellulovorans 743B]
MKDNTVSGIVTKGIGGFYYVQVEDKIIECKARGKFRTHNISPYVGDVVELNIEEDKGFIIKISERKNLLLRPVVANVTQAFVVFALKNPDVNLTLLNKFLILCEYNEIKPIICFNKVDLVDNPEEELAVKMIKQTGYDYIFLKAKEKYNLELVMDHLNENISIFCGPSGAGKSTLFNGMVGKPLMEIGEVSEKLKRGKHTTRHSELIAFHQGYIVDTPGFSSLEFDFIDEVDLKNYLPEFKEYEDQCKFSGCNHYKEPKCAVKTAVEEEKIHKSRYDFYISLYEELKGRRYKK